MVIGGGGETESVNSVNANVTQVTSQERRLMHP